MPDSMIERIARAICAKACEGIPGAFWEHEDADVWSHYRDLARAAVEALREPTEAMLKAAGEADLKHAAGCLGASLPQEDTWGIMIDAILAEGQPASPVPATEGSHG